MENTSIFVIAGKKNEKEKKRKKQLFYELLGKDSL